MRRHHRLFDGLAADFAATSLLGAPVPGGPALADGALARVRAGERFVEV